jgi:hypothetical protein
VVAFELRERLLGAANVGAQVDGALGPGAIGTLDELLPRFGVVVSDRLADVTQQRVIEEFAAEFVVSAGGPEQREAAVAALEDGGVEGAAAKVVDSDARAGMKIARDP